MAMGEDDGRSILTDTSASHATRTALTSSCCGWTTSASRYTLASFRELPEYVKDNPSSATIHASRPLAKAARSLFRWHNEKLSVWSNSNSARTNISYSKELLLGTNSLVNSNQIMEEENEDQFPPTSRDAVAVLCFLGQIHVLPPLEQHLPPFLKPITLLEQPIAADGLCWHHGHDNHLTATDLHQQK
ncbi:uncharacterized protein LOC108960651 [Eucalyptus grandis]|uniref:uncharacterized protein LOC108960651 n=1 Tax=Eucalyptus grandis TaxID=71139 RepID=UPI00192F0146|nr:uncharacterized protein LOC108960651 [Eucalyptus grandis]